MRILVIGGTVYLGRAVVDSSLAAGAEVTTFNRGRSGTDDPRVRAVRGDRTSADDLTRLAAAGPWDAVVDTSPQVPRDVLASGRALDQAADRYVVVTSLSVHSDWAELPISVTSPLFACEPDAGADDGHYGELKAGCERAATSVLGDRAVIVRPGIILGPYEDVGRLPWWLLRFSRGGRVPVAPLDRPFQAVDVRDLADLLVRLAEAGSPDGGPVLAIGPTGRDTYGDFVTLASEASGGGAELVEMPDKFLQDEGITAWSELPLWMPPGPDGSLLHHFDVDPSTAVAAGLRSRDLAETVSDTWAWLRDAPDYRPRADIGLAPDREAGLLAAWDARSSG
jgi:2'-hydroxyisoflavone reductase